MLQSARTFAVATTALTLLLLSAGCGDDSAKSDDASTVSTDDASTASTYETQAFRIPFEVAVPSWAATPGVTVDSPNFVTWDSPEPSRPAVRFLLPAGLYRPGDAQATEAPADYLDYLHSLEDFTASLTDTSDTTVGGQSATLLTATTTEAIDGSLGCPDVGLPPEDCFGLQPENALRMAVIDLSGQTMLAWIRHEGSADSSDAAQDFADFEQMLESVRFLDREPVSASPSPSATATPLDGTWTTSFSRKSLAKSPLLYDAGEFNDQNWGDFTLVFERGHFTFEQQNRVASYASAGEFTVEGDVLTMTLENSEVFEMRFAVAGDELRFERDDSLGIAPTPFLLRPWVRS